ncbi:MAG: hypothetical protein JST90_06085 [Bacteroidetes bacterium]|nr:hypothetical protein [Bacteroidota bacterium]
MRHILILLAFICLGSAAASAQKGAAAQTGYCLMRVFDVNKFAAQGAGFIGSKIIITYEDGNQETIPLEAYSEKTEPGNLKIIVDNINKLRKKGYILMSANSTGDQGNIVTDYVLLKQGF